MDFPVVDVELPSQLQTSSELEAMVNLKGREVEDRDVSTGIRIRAIRQEGLRVGAQTGLAARYSMIMEYWSSVEEKLNVTFSFTGFVREGRLLMPAIVQVDNALSYDPETGAATQVQKAYTVEEEARVVTSIPTWRDYVYQVYERPEAPHESLLPRNDEEVDEWKKALREGWTAGVFQADQIYEDRVNQLVRAVEGRHLYRTLEAKNMISPAALRVESNRVTFNGRTMNIGETIYMVGGDAQYNTAADWKPVWTR
ncbi:hypothetical protein LCGC14_0282970 [marine sediment metagenome]|uniref:Uncharacterized protein n=1 Tax=marine sediment metagenome TaxID=412755 RepID=A0A0F9X132_9ZZZZ